MAHEVSLVSVDPQRMRGRQQGWTWVCACGKRALMTWLDQDRARWSGERHVAVGTTGAESACAGRTASEGPGSDQNTREAVCDPQ